MQLTCWCQSMTWLKSCTKWMLIKSAATTDLNLKRKWLIGRTTELPLCNSKLILSGFTLTWLFLLLFLLAKLNSVTGQSIFSPNLPFYLAFSRNFRPLTCFSWREPSTCDLCVNGNGNVIAVRIVCGSLKMSAIFEWVRNDHEKFLRFSHDDEESAWNIFRGKLLTPLDHKL